MPIYNAEKYVAKTLENICTQTYKNLEIICVLDAPTDSSEKIVRSIKDRRIKIINLKKNVGTAEAKNTGAKKATGSWLHFMDSDDLIIADFYEKMLKCIALSDDIDVIASSAFYEARPKHSIWISKNEIVSGKHKWKKTEVLIHGWMWRYLIHRDFWDKNKIKFPRLSVMEDMPAMVEMIFHAKNIALCADAVYFYKNRQTSAVNQMTDKKRVDWMAGRKMVHEFMHAHKIRKPNRFLYLLKRI